MCSTKSELMAKKCPKMCNLCGKPLTFAYGLFNVWFRSNSELFSVPLSMKMKKTLGDKAFTAAAPSLWNKLLSAIRDENSFETFQRFKSKFKTFLFRVAYNELFSLYFFFRLEFFYCCNCEFIN